VSNVPVRPATSWLSVLGGWIATVGAMALVAPAVAGIVSRANIGESDIAPAVPVVIGIFIAYLIGGYVAGRMAGYRTSWHGMLTAFFSLFVLLVLALLSYGADRGLFSGLGIKSLSDLVPGASGLNVDSIGNALTFGALLGFLAAIFAGWLGGLVAPAQAVMPRARPNLAREAGPVPGRAVGVGPAADRSVKREVVRERRPLLPAFGRKGGERAVPERVVEESRDPGAGSG
jgi:putative membrane protein (TIGR04086 family)